MDNPPTVEEHRHPNPPGSVPDLPKSEEQMLIAEMSGLPAWRAYLQTIVAPRVSVIREALLVDFELSEAERMRLQAALAEHRRLLTAVYASTEAGELPNWVAQMLA